MSGAATHETPNRGILTLCVMLAIDVVRRSTDPVPLCAREIDSEISAVVSCAAWAAMRDRFAHQPKQWFDAIKRRTVAADHDCQRCIFRADVAA